MKPMPPAVPPDPSSPPAPAPAEASGRSLLPGMAAIAVWMLITAVFGVFGVLGHHFARGAQANGVLLIATFYVVAALGLMRLRRWGWALSLGAVVLSMCFFSYSLFRFHQLQYIVMATVNLIFFLYLVRPEIRERLR